jgi:hypothetical protein
MFLDRLFCLWVITLTITSTCTPQFAIKPNTTATEPSKSHTTLPFVRTTCTKGVDLSGRTINFYQIVEESDPIMQSLMVGYQDATTYFNTHGGICGAALAQVFPENGISYNVPTIYHDFSTRNPKPVLVAVYYSGDAAALRDQLAHDTIPALEGLGGDYVGPYGDDGQSPGWVFGGTNPTYPDQFGSVCDYLVSNSDHFPKPVIGFMDFGGSSEVPYPEASSYCESLGIRFAGASRFPEAATNIRPQVQKLVDAGANVIYTQARLSGTALIAKTLRDLGLQEKITLIGSHLVLDPETFTASPLGLDENGIPFLNGLIGSMPTRSLSETSDPGIKLIVQQADLHQRPMTARTNSYIRAWVMTDLFIETYIQTGNRVGFDHVTGAEIKATLENLVYAPLGGVEQIDFRNGQRSLSTNRIGQLDFLGQDGKTPAGPGNPPMVVTVGNQQLPVPVIIPLTDFQRVPDLRPSGAHVPTSTP